MPNQPTQPSFDTLAATPTGAVVNASCVIFRGEHVSVVWVHGIPAFRWEHDDVAALRLFVAQALELDYAKPGQLARAINRSVRWVQRARDAYLEGGVDALVPHKRGPKGARLGKQREMAVERLRKQGLSLRHIARTVGTSHSTVRRTARRLGVEPPSPAPAAQSLLWESDAGSQGEARGDASEGPDEAAAVAQPDMSAISQADTAAAEQSSTAAAQSGDDRSDTVVQPSVRRDVPATLDSDPDNRAVDRMLAHLGELLDAAPLFKDRVGLSRVGVLLAIPLIVQSGVLDAARRVYGDIGPAFYGLRTSLMTLLFMALLRIKNPESLKCHNPAEIGWLLGLDRAPEMKTLRRKLLHLGDETEPTEAFLRELVQRRVAARQQALGFLYVDGHVRVYTGKADLPKAHVARMRISMPATQEVWVNDGDGAPLFFVTQDAHGQLVSELPRVLTEVRELVGPDRRVTVVFDRGGWSPDLFARMDAGGFDVLTYRKGKVEPLAASLFTTVEVPGSGGREHYELADTQVKVGTRRLVMRQVTRRTVGRRGNEHQTHIVTTRRDLSAAQVAWRMFERWRQENFFKYMRQQFAIDALVQYGVEDADPNRDVPNPAHKAATKALAAARAELRRLQAQYGDALAHNDENKRRTVRGLKIATGREIGVPLRAAEERVADLQAVRATLPKRVPISSVNGEVVQLARSRKQLSDGLKMLAYQLETDLVTMVTPHYKRAQDEGRRLVAAAMQSRGDIEVRGAELRVTLAPQASPHRTRAIAALCSALDATKTRFPGTNLRLRLRIEDSPDRDRSLSG